MSQILNAAKVATTYHQAIGILNFLNEDHWRLPSQSLMVTPEHFRIDYAINPYMNDAHGRLKIVNQEVALQQWHNLKSTFERLGVKVSTIAGSPNLPDMVFAANQSLVFWHNDVPNVLMSRMQSAQRRPEVALFEHWYRAQGYAVHSLESSSDISFEGNGDALLDPKYRLIWGGTGPRSNPWAYQEIASRFDIPVILLPLKCLDFYHLDTCFAILGPESVAIQPRAFDDQTLKIIRSRFSTVIEIEYDENIKFFAGNCHVPRGKDVVLQAGATKFLGDLKKHGFTPHEVDTSEFMKSGGSVFCMKMMVF
jgi:N-dimethylarginine dimethylaminohydrolase